MSQPTYQWIISISGNEQIYIVPGQRVEIGRKPLRPLPDNGVMRLEIMDSSRSMSKRHALFYVDEQGRAFMRDLQSTNGTYMIGSAQALMKLSAQRDFMLPTSPVRMQFGDAIVADFIKVQRDTVDMPVSVADLFAYGHEQNSVEPSVQELSVDDILNLRAGEPTSVLQVQHLRRNDAVEDEQAVLPVEQTNSVKENQVVNSVEAAELTESNELLEPDGLFKTSALSESSDLSQSSEQLESFEADESEDMSESGESHQSYDSNNSLGSYESVLVSESSGLEESAEEEYALPESAKVTEEVEASELENLSGESSQLAKLADEPAETSVNIQDMQDLSSESFALHIKKFAPMRDFDMEHPVEHVSVTMIPQTSETINERDLFNDARIQEQDLLTSQENLEQVIPQAVSQVTSSVSGGLQSLAVNQELTMQESAVREPDLHASDLHTSEVQAQVMQESVSLAKTASEQSAESEQSVQNLTQQQQREHTAESYQPAFEPGSVFARVMAGNLDARDETVKVAGHSSVEARTTTDYSAQFDMSKHEQLRPFLAMNPSLYDDLYTWLHALGDPTIDEALAANAGYARYRQAMEG